MCGPFCNGGADTGDTMDELDCMLNCRQQVLSFSCAAAPFCGLAAGDHWSAISNCDSKKGKPCRPALLWGLRCFVRQVLTCSGREPWTCCPGQARSGPADAWRDIWSLQTTSKIDMSPYTEYVVQISRSLFKMDKSGFCCREQNCALAIAQADGTALLA